MVWFNTNDSDKIEKDFLFLTQIGPEFDFPRTRAPQALYSTSKLRLKQTCIKMFIVEFDNLTDIMYGHKNVFWDRKCFHTDQAQLKYLSEEENCVHFMQFDCAHFLLLSHFSYNPFMCYFWAISGMTPSCTCAHSNYGRHLKTRVSKSCTVVRWKCKGSCHHGPDKKHDIS